MYFFLTGSLISMHFLACSYKYSFFPSFCHSFRFFSLFISLDNHSLFFLHLYLYYSILTQYFSLFSLSLFIFLHFPSSFVLTAPLSHLVFHYFLSQNSLDIFFAVFPNKLNLHIFDFLFCSVSFLLFLSHFLLQYFFCCCFKLDMFGSLRLWKAKMTNFFSQSLHIIDLWHKGRNMSLFF